MPQVRPKVTIPFLLGSLEALLQRHLALEEAAAAAPVIEPGYVPRSRVGLDGAVQTALHMLLDLTPDCLQQLVDPAAREEAKQVQVCSGRQTPSRGPATTTTATTAGICAHPSRLLLCVACNGSAVVKRRPQMPWYRLSKCV